MSWEYITCIWKHRVISTFQDLVLILKMSLILDFTQMRRTGSFFEIIPIGLFRFFSGWAGGAFCKPEVPFAFEFESEWPNGNLVIKQLLNCHSPKWPNGNLLTVLSPNCHSAIQTFRLKLKCKRNLRYFENTAGVVNKFGTNQLGFPKLLIYRK